MVRSGQGRFLVIIFITLAVGTALVRLIVAAMPLGREASPELFLPDEAGEIGVKTDPLTGLHLSPTEDAEYFAAVIENSPAARPQRGLAAASLVYEMLAEGGITRFLAFYSESSSLAIGPIRSVRSYMVDIAAQHGAVLAHCGGSPDALRMIDQLGYPSVNEFEHARIFYRDKARRAPHNLYAKAESILKYARDMGYPTESAHSGYVFTEEEASGGLSANEMTISYWPGYSVKWEYDRGTNSWLRSIAQEPHIDLNTGGQIAAKNVIVEVVKTKVVDREGRLYMELAGSGEALVFSRGQVTRGRWIRDSSLREPAVYVSETGASIQLCPGITWVQIVPTRTAVKISSV